MIPVLMSGGAGTRLWPLSRQLMPKQFLPLTGKHSMLQETLLRLKGLEFSAPIVVCNEDHRFIAAQQLLEIDAKGSLILEPAGRNTAPALALAAIEAESRVQGAELLLVLAADHDIRDPVVFRQVVSTAIPAAQAGKLVTFGIVPSRPDTGYGYIQAEGTDPVRPIRRFLEKPDLATAETLLAAGGHFWNSGMFLFRADRLLEELGRHRPDILAACRTAMAGKTPDQDFIRPAREAFLACPAQSIDYAVMEKTRDAVMVPLDAGWSDVGAWSALQEIRRKDARGNSIIGDAMLVDCDRCLVQGEERIIAAIGLKDLLIVDTRDALLVSTVDQAGKVKEIVARLDKEGRQEHLNHTKVHRPWGHYEQIDRQDRYQVKRLTVKPGAKLSLQLHHHRAEHWVVVSGTAEVTRGDEILHVHENEAVYLPIGMKHALANPGRIPLVLIETQIGSYLGEDDIVRFEDRYGRA
ncbi:MAG: Mannose-phosphate guanylyltransferase 1 [Verrucomicrobiota bacterium]